MTWEGDHNREAEARKKTIKLQSQMTEIRSEERAFRNKMLICCKKIRELNREALTLQDNLQALFPSVPNNIWKVVNEQEKIASCAQTIKLLAAEITQAHTSQEVIQNDQE